MAMLLWNINGQYEIINKNKMNKKLYDKFLLKFGQTIKQIWSMPLQCRYTKYIVWHVSIAA